MNIVTIYKSLMLKYAGDPEILQKDNRPCVLIVRLKYKGKNQDFAVPYPSYSIMPIDNRENLDAYNRATKTGKATS